MTDFNKPPRKPEQSPGLNPIGPAEMISDIPSTRGGQSMDTPDPSTPDFVRSRPSPRPNPMTAMGADSQPTDRPEPQGPVTEQTPSEAPETPQNKDREPAHSPTVPSTPEPKNAPTADVPSHDNIAVTAINNAMVMTYSGVPLYPEISEAAQALWTADNHEVQPELIKPEVNAPGFEVRYRLGNLLTKDSAQVMEVASGLTPRGLTMATANPERTYVEFDLPITIDLKNRVIESLESQGIVTRPDNLHLEPGNILDAETVTRASRHFDPNTPVTITSEGLLHYLPHSEKAAMAQNIGALLREFGGVWYTDMPVSQGVTAVNSPMANITTQQTGRDVKGNRFANEDEAKAFFADQGLEVKRLYPYTDPSLIDSLTSINTVNTSRDRVMAENRPWSMWAIGLPEHPESA